MISFNGQYPLKLFLWVWGALILFFLIRFTNWKAAIWRQFSFHEWKFCHMFEIPATKQKPLQSSLFQIITRVSAF